MKWFHIPLVLLPILLSFGIPVSVSQTQLSIWDGVYTETQAAAGEALYEASCASCHGVQLQGVGMAPALVGGDFLWAYHGLFVEVLHSRIRQTMPPDDPESIGSSESSEILAYILQVNDLPAGERTLSDRAQVLRLIQWIAAP